MSIHECEYDMDGGECRICGKTVLEQLVENLAKQCPDFNNLQVHGLMPRERRPYGFPVSRDWEHIDCHATGCKYNYNKSCRVPSRAKIGVDGRCEGFETPPLQINNPDGD